MFVMRKAQESELERVVGLYQSIKEDSEGLLCMPECLMEPVQREFLARSINQKQLFLGLWNDILVGSVVINHEPHPEFEEIEWVVDAPKEQVGIIHCLGVVPKYQDLGLGKEMLLHAVSGAKAAGLKALRYDVLKSDIPLQHCVAVSGFRFRGIVMRRLTERRTLPYGMYEREL